MSAASNFPARMTAQLKHHRFTVEAYDRMAELGILAEGDRVELLAGEIVEKMTIGSPHAACVDRLNRLFIVAVGERAIVRIQGPIVLPPDSEPEPDLTLLAPREDFYAGAHPRPDDVLLAVEVADSSLLLDRTIKLPLYAAAKIVETWIVNLADKAIEIHCSPVDGRYTSRRVVERGGSLSPVSFPDITLNGSDILP